MQEQFTVRIYDVELVNKIKDLEKQLRNIYHSKRNPFFSWLYYQGNGSYWER